MSQSFQFDPRDTAIVCTDPARVFISNRFQLPHRPPTLALRGWS
jgi:hypothetical protein